MYRGSSAPPNVRVFRHVCRGAVEERPHRAEEFGVSQLGVMRSANVGISSKKSGEKPDHRKSKVSWATMIVPGLGGPKANLTRSGGSRWIAG